MRHTSVTSNLDMKTNKWGSNKKQQPQPPLAFRQQGFGRGHIERPPLVLGQQPPLLGSNQPVIVNFTQTVESPMEQMQALVLIGPYAKEESSIALVETQRYKEVTPIHPP